MSAVRITLDDYFHVATGRVRSYGGELTDQRRANAARTVDIVNELIDIARDHGARVPARVGGSLVNSGWRPVALNNSTRNASARSLHTECKAVDVYDPDGELDRWCVENEKTLEALGLWMEDPGATPGWCHLQTEPPPSGRRIFQPGRKFDPDERFADWPSRITARAPAALKRRQDARPERAADPVPARATEPASRPAPSPDAPRTEAPPSPVKAEPKPESTADTAKPLPQRPVEPPRPPPGAPQKSLLRSRTIWGALLAAAATVTEAVRSNVSSFAAMFPKVETSKGPVNTAWILVGVTILALLWIIYARIDDRRKQRR